MSYDLKNVLNALEQFGGTFERANDESITLRAAGDDAPITTQPSLGRVLNEEDRFYLQRSLMSMSGQELSHLFYLQLGSKAGGGVPLAQWMFGGNRGLAEFAGSDPTIQNLLDLSGGSALVRQDLDPILYP
jgi:hypothetical protein